MISTTDLVRELIYQIRLGEDSAYEFKDVVIKGDKVTEPHRDSSFVLMNNWCRRRGSKP